MIVPTCLAAHATKNRQKKKPYRFPYAAEGSITSAFRDLPTSPRRSALPRSPCKKCQHTRRVRGGLWGPETDYLSGKQSPGQQCSVKPQHLRHLRRRGRISRSKNPKMSFCTATAAYGRTGFRQSRPDGGQGTGVISVDGRCDIVHMGRLRQDLPGQQRNLP